MRSGRSQDPPRRGPERLVFGVRPTTGIAAVVVALALIAGLALHLRDTQEQGQRTQREALQRRATLTARLIGSAFAASSSAGDARARFGGPRAAVARSVGRYAAAERHSRVVVLDARGRVLASADRATARRVAGHPDVRAALRGRRALSDLFLDGHGGAIVDLAVPFPSRYGRRVLVVAAPVE